MQLAVYDTKANLLTVYEGRKVVAIYGFSDGGTPCATRIEQLRTATAVVAA